MLHKTLNLAEHACSDVMPVLLDLDNLSRAHTKCPAVQKAPRPQHWRQVLIQTNDALAGVQAVCTESDIRLLESQDLLQWAL